MVTGSDNNGDDEDDITPRPPYKIDPHFLEGDEIYSGQAYDERLDLEALGAMAAENVSWDSKSPVYWESEFDALMSLIAEGGAPEPTAGAVPIPGRSGRGIWLYDTAGGYVAITGDERGTVEWKSFRSMGNAYRHAMKWRDL